MKYYSDELSKVTDLIALLSAIEIIRARIYVDTANKLWRIVSRVFV